MSYRGKKRTETERLLKKRPPIPEYDNHYAFDPRRHFIRYVYSIQRDRLMQDLFEKLTR